MPTNDIYKKVFLCHLIETNKWRLMSNVGLFLHKIELQEKQNYNIHFGDYKRTSLINKRLCDVAQCTSLKIDMLGFHTGYGFTYNLMLYFFKTICHTQDLLMNRQKVMKIMKNLSSL